ncbi:hypothetical protein BH11PSE11_BH11PSE11_19340 [soil metagenome]
MFEKLTLRPEQPKPARPLLRSTLSKQIGIVSLLLLLLAAANVSVVHGMLQDINGVAETINVAGKLRMLSQKIAFKTLKALAEDSPQKNEVTPAIGDFENALNALEKGGLAFGYQIRKVSAQHSVEIDAIRHDWNLYQEHVATALRLPSPGTPMTAEINRVAKASAGVLANAETLVGSLTSEAHQAQQLALTKIYLLLLLDAIVLILVFLALRRKIVQPLHALWRGSLELASGNYHVRLPYRTPDEIGQLAKAFNHAAHQIGKLISRIEAERQNIQEAESMFRGLAENSVVGVYIVQDDAFRFANPKMARMFDYKQEEMTRSVQVSEILVDAGRSLAQDASDGVTGDDAEEVNRELRARRRDGSTFDVEVFGSKMQIDGKLATIGVMLDVTERKRVDRALRVLVASNQALVRATDETALLADICRIVQQISGYPFVWVGYVDETKSKKVVPVALAEVDGGTLFSTVNKVSWDNSDIGEGVTGRAIRTGRTILAQDIPSHHSFAPWRDFMERHHILSAISLPLMAGSKVIGALTMYSPDSAVIPPDEIKIAEELADNLAYGITALRADMARRQYAMQLEHNANHDVLTGLGNRSLLSDRLRQAIASASRSRQMIAVLLLDLDHFKVVNDTLGHAAGDALLLAVADRLRASVRTMDTVARLGGDEFVIVMPEVTEEEKASVVASKILEVLSQSFFVANQEIHIGASIGISLYPKDGENEKVLLKNVDLAMYRAKQNGRANFNFYTEEMNAHNREHNALQNELHFALGRGELMLHYQPKVDLHTCEIVGVEALVRWQHPERGLILPEKFIPLAESNGLIIPIGTWVIRTACAQNKAWQEAGLRPVNVAVNISAWQFHRRDLVAVVRQALIDFDLEPKYLELELTESVIIQEADEVIPVMRALKALGVQLSMDDFGTGYSSLNYLRRFPFDNIKIDRLFVEGITSNLHDLAIVKAVIALAHSLDLKVTAEGVETEAELDFLQQYDCDEIQGYFFSRPVTHQQFTDLLESGKSLSKRLGDIAQSGYPAPH